MTAVRHVRAAVPAKERHNVSTCGAPAQGGAVTVAPGATVIEGTVTHDGAGLVGAYVRLHDSSGEFTAEVVSPLEIQIIGRCVKLQRTL